MRIEVESVTIRSSKMYAFHHIRRWQALSVIVVALGIPLFYASKFIGMYYGPIAAAALWSGINIAVLIIVSQILRLFMGQTGWIPKLLAILCVVIATPVLCFAGAMFAAQVEPFRILMIANDMGGGGFFPNLNGLAYTLISVALLTVTNLVVSIIVIVGGRDSWAMQSIFRRNYPNKG